MKGFAPTFRGEPLFDWYVPASGVRHSELLDWIQAAVWANHTPEDFFQKEVEYQCQIMAAYIITRREDAVVAKAQADEAKAKNGS